MIVPAVELKRLLKQAAAKEDLLIDTETGRLVSVSPDLTVVVSSSLLKSETSDKVVVDGKKFSSVAARLSGTVEIAVVNEEKERNLLIKSARATVKLPTKPPIREFNPPAEDKSVSLPLSAIKPILAWASGSVSKNVAEQYGQVVSVKSSGGHITAAGTDGARLAMAKIPFSGPQIDYLIPMSAVQSLSSFEGETVEVDSTDHYYHFYANNVDIYANRISRDFPNYQAFVPKSFKVVYQVDAEAFKNCLLTVKPLVTEIGEPAISVHFLDNQVSVSTRDGAAVDSTDYTQFTPDDAFDPIEMKIPISLDSILSFFANVTGDVLLSVNSGKQPIWLESGSKQMLLAVLAN